MNIEDVLTKGEILTVEAHAKQGASYHTVRALFPRLTEAEITLFVSYYRELREAKGVCFGAKEMPYYSSEEYDDLHPQYKWSELPLAEKAWYNIRVKNGNKI